MKIRIRQFWIIFFGCILLCGITPVNAAAKKKPAQNKQAAKKKPAPKKKPGHVRWADMPSIESKEFKRFDSNHDGVLDEAERKRIQTTFRSNPTDSYLLPYDRDSDKNLTDKEIAGIPPKEIDQKALEKMQEQKKGKK